MTMHFAEAAAAARFSVADRLQAFCETASFDRPTLVIDADLVEAQYHALKAGLGHAHVHYAVKANPHRAIIERLVALGSRFDCASRGKSSCACRWARGPSRSLMATRSSGWRTSPMRTARGSSCSRQMPRKSWRRSPSMPRARRSIRLIVEVSQADWPLSRKFGCDGATALRLLDHAKVLGLTAARVFVPCRVRRPGGPRCGRRRSMPLRASGGSEGGWP